MGVAFGAVVTVVLQWLVLLFGIAANRCSGGRGEARKCSYDGKHGAREPARPRPKLENALNGASARNDEAENERDQKERSGRPRSPAIKATGVNLDCDEGRHWNPE